VKRNENRFLFAAQVNLLCGVGDRACRGRGLIVISVNGQCPPINEVGVTCATKFSQRLADFGLAVAAFALDTGVPVLLAVGGLIFLMRDLRRKTNQAPS
jgi:hypothetical protein